MTLADRIRTRCERVAVRTNDALYARYMNATAAILAVLDLHRRFPIYDECGHAHTQCEPGVISIEDVGLACDDGWLYDICLECCTGGTALQSDECATRHGHDSPACWPCNTIRVQAQAFGIGEGTG